MWGEFLNSVEDHAKANYFRLNIALPGAVLLDDVSSMTMLRESVRSSSGNEATRQNVAKGLLIRGVIVSREQFDAGPMAIRSYQVCRSWV